MKLYLYILTAILAPLVGNARVMQNSGKRAPVPYSQFGLPAESLSIAAQYLPSNPVIVEAGAYDGKETCVLASYWPRGYIHSFEPVQELFKKVVSNTKHVSNISVYNLALGVHCGPAIFYLSVEPEDTEHVSQSSSLYPPKEHLNYSTSLFERTESVTVTTLDEWAEQQGVEKVDMLWLDMQGYELPALKASPKILSGVSVILTELEFVEAYMGQPLYKEVRAWLAEQGFVLVAGNFGFPKHPGTWFGDGLFVRRELVHR
jgi:FkbM family methyltransferase